MTVMNMSVLRAAALLTCACVAACIPTRDPQNRHAAPDAFQGIDPEVQASVCQAHGDAEGPADPFCADCAPEVCERATPDQIVRKVTDELYDFARDRKQGVRKSLGDLHDEARVVEGQWETAMGAGLLGRLSANDAAQTRLVLEAYVGKLRSFRQRVRELSARKIDNVLLAQEMLAATWLRDATVAPEHCTRFETGKIEDAYPTLVDCLEAKIDLLADNLGFVAGAADDLLSLDLPLTRREVSLDQVVEMRGQTTLKLGELKPDAAAIDAKVAMLVARTSPDDPAPRWRGEITRLVRKMVTPAQVQLVATVYFERVAGELDRMIALQQNHIVALDGSFQLGRPEDLGGARPALGYVSQEELFVAWSREPQVVMGMREMVAIAEAQWSAARRVPVDDDGVEELLADESEKQVLAETLVRHYARVLEQPAFITCTSATEPEPFPCYVDAAVLSIVIGSDPEVGAALTERYLAPLTDTYLRLANRLTSADEYRLGLIEYKRFAFESYRHAISYLNDTTVCEVKRDLHHGLVEAANQSRIGAAVLEVLPWARDRRAYAEALDEVTRAEVVRVLGDMQRGIESCTSFRDARAFVDPAAVSAQLGRIAATASSAARTYLEDYAFWVGVGSQVAKIGANVVVVAAGTALVPVSGGTSLAAAMLVVGGASGVTETVLTFIDNPSERLDVAFARGFLAGAIPVPVDAAARSVVIQFARARAMGALGAATLTATEHVTVNAVSGAATYLAQNVVEGRAIRLSELGEAAATGAAFTGLTFGGTALLRVGRAHLARRAGIDAAAFDGLVPKLVALGADIDIHAPEFVDPAGGTRWARVYEKLAPMLGSGDARAALRALLSPDERALIDGLMLGYGPAFVAPASPTSSEAAKRMREIADRIRVDSRRLARYLIVDEAGVTARLKPAYQGRYDRFNHPQVEVEWADPASPGQVTRIGMRRASDWRTSNDPDLVALRARIERFIARIHEADAAALAGRYQNEGGALTLLLDKCFLEEINVQVNPRWIERSAFSVPTQIVIDAGPRGHRWTVDEMTQLFRRWLSNRQIDARGGSVIDTASGELRGYALIPDLVIRTEGGRVSFNDPKVEAISHFMYRMAKEEITHALQLQAKDGTALLSPHTEKVYRDFLNATPFERHHAINSGFADVIDSRMILEVDFMTFVTQHTEDFLATSNELFERYPGRGTFLKYGEEQRIPGWRPLAVVMPRDRVVPFRRSN